jgi:hypothetical protein
MTEIVKNILTLHSARFRNLAVCQSIHQHSELVTHDIVLPYERDVWTELFNQYI